MKVVKHPTSPVKKLTKFFRTYLNHNQVLIVKDFIHDLYYYCPKKKTVKNKSFYWIWFYNLRLPSVRVFITEGKKQCFDYAQQPARISSKLEGRGRGAEGQRGRGAEGQRSRGAEGQRGKNFYESLPCSPAQAKALSICEKSRSARRQE
ncbi:hypothetical protein [Nostoc sp. DedQUE09]|uniref:hypothetical protein n=1 Tax=Nostoc sp. DedQUE09 TaxID=3075394 RepID=UPI002AD231F8|nr:hypothetical protein [Nostoc sp. DedQUE09]MDZ7955138.1 hypothetical protein [Nostoc sp. DedQUE09]